MTLQLTHPNKILYPGTDITKIVLANYYQDIQEWILPYIAKRPLTLVRCPDGNHKNCFFQKHVTHPMPGLHNIEIQEKKKVEPYLYMTQAEGLIALVQMGVLEIHLWNCKIDNIERPDLIIFDLDPAPDVAWKEVVKAAFLIRDGLSKIGLISFVKTTGGKGLHIVIPIRRLYSWEIIKDFSHKIVKAFVLSNPNMFIGVMTKAKRNGKIFIDYLRNQRGATSIAPYSTRARKDAPVATPLSWDELTSKIKPNQFTIKNIQKRLSGLRTDPWEDFFKIKQSIKYNF